MENLDRLSLGDYLTSDHLKQTRMVENTRTLGLMYDILQAPWKAAKDPDVLDISRPGKPDNSAVCQVVEKGQRAQDAAIKNATAFGEVLSATFQPLTGWAYTYNINPAIVRTELAEGGTAVKDGSSIKIDSGNDPAGKARVETVRSSRYVPGIGGLARFTAVFSEPVEGAKQVIGIINGTDGWGFGYNGTKFGTVRIKGGTEFWDYQENWTDDPRPDLDPQKGNVYEIRYQWLGYGMQYFSVENDSGTLEVVNRIRYANHFDDVSVTNPNLPIAAYVQNGGNSSPVWIKSPSAIAGLEGDAFNDSISSNVGADVEKSIEAGENIGVAAFRIGETYKGAANRLFAQALRLTFATDGAKPVTFRAYINPTVTGGTWDYISEEVSPLEFNGGAISVTGGILVGTYAAGKVDTLDIDLVSSEFRMYPGQVIAMTASGAQASDIVAAANWRSYL